MKIPPVTLRADYMYDALKGDQAIHRFVAARILVTTSLVDVIHCSYIILWNCIGKALWNGTKMTVVAHYDITIHNGGLPGVMF